MAVFVLRSGTYRCRHADNAREDRWPRADRPPRHGGAGGTSVGKRRFERGGRAEEGGRVKSLSLILVRKDYDGGSPMRNFRYARSPEPQLLGRRMNIAVVFPVNRTG